MKQFTKSLGIAVLGALLALGINELREKDEVETTQGNVMYQAPAKATYFSNSESSSLPSFTEVAQTSIHAVVHVNTEYNVRAYNDPLAEMFGRKAPQQRARGAGSGVIIDADGYIVTNNHVIEGAEKIYVTTNDNKTFEAEVLGSDPSTDIALLKVDQNHLPFMTFGNSDEAQVGEWVLAVGNPFNLTSTVTAGIISAKSRNINLLGRDRSSFPIESFIQTDAAVNPGNSGGALVNARGELIGINTAIASRTGSYSGYSFAVPSSIVQKVAGDILEYGEVQRALIGVSIQNVNQAIADRLGIEEVSGILVNGLTNNGAAKDAGIEEGDVIVGVNGDLVKNVPELQEQIGRFRPGDHVVLSIIRKGEVRDFDVELRNKIGGTAVINKSDLDINKLLEAELVALDQYDLRKYGLYNGFQVKEFKGEKLSRLGIKEGFIITHIDRRPVSSKEEIAQILLNSNDGILISGIYPNGQKAYYGLGV